MLRGDSFFCLRGATLAVGVLFLTDSLFQLSQHAVVCVTAAEVDMAHLHGVTVPLASRDEALDHGVTSAQRLTVSAAVTVLLLLQLLFDIALVHGARVSPTQPATGRRCVLAWVVFRAVLYVLLSLGCVAILVLARDDGNERLFHVPPGQTVSFAVASLLYWGGWVLAAAFYGHLRATADVAWLKVPTEEKPRAADAGPGEAEVAVAAAGMV